MSGAAIRFAGATVRYPGADRAAIEDVSFEASPGELLVLLGPSGCGKSTLLRTVNRLVPLDAGSVCVDGRDVTSVDAVELRRTIGYAIQAVGTVRTHDGRAERRGRSVAARVAARRNRAPASTNFSRWSGSNRRAIAAGVRANSPAARRNASASRARLRRDPRVLLMDEPFGAVDALVRASLQRELARIVRDLETTTLFVTHDFDEALKLADRIVVMRGGRVEQLAAPGELLDRPATAYVRDLVHAGDDVYRRYYLHVRETIAKR